MKSEVVTASRVSGSTSRFEEVKKMTEAEYKNKIEVLKAENRRLKFKLEWQKTIVHGFAKKILEEVK